jgi:hypothetical protein
MQSVIPVSGAMVDDVAEARVGASATALWK